MNFFLSCAGIALIILAVGIALGEANLGFVNNYYCNACCFEDEDWEEEENK